MKSIVVVVMVLCVLVECVVSEDGGGVKNIWPMPVSANHGDKIVYLSNDFQLKTEGSKYNDSSSILKEGFSRFLDVVKLAHVVDGDLSKFDASAILKGLHVVILSSNDEVCYLQCVVICIFF